MKGAKRVSFTTVKEEEEGHCYNEEDDLSKGERKALCWYSEDELSDSREDARLAVEALQKVDGDFDAVDQSKYCLRGVEKYADVAIKVMLQKRLVDSVLHQQETNRTKRIKSGEEHIALVSKMLSQPFKDVAQYHALRNAEQVLHSEDSSTPTPASPEPCDRSAAVVSPPCSKEHCLLDESVEEAEEEPMGVQMDCLKRSRPTEFGEGSLPCRNVKPCLQSSE